MNNIEFISAGAGSGKTYKLTSMLAQALETGAARPHAILATTFTVKAATELRERARSWLLEKGRIDLATAVGQAKLGTVNSVCGQMLKRFCFELGLSPDQTVLSEGQARRLLDSSFAETLDAAGQSELVHLTARLGIDQADWSKSIKDILKAALENDIPAETLRSMGARNADLMLANWPQPSTGADPTAALLETLTGAMPKVKSYIEQTQASGGKVAKNLLEGLSDIQRLERAFREDRWTWPDWIAACGLDAGAKVKDLLLPVQEAAQCHESHPKFHAEVRRYLHFIFDLAADALAAYAEAKKVIGAVDFSDQEVLLLRAIRQSAAVREALAGELDLVMVDEFQDTSPLQLALFVEFSKLAKRSIWVGDPKQAIYGFRGSDARLISRVLGAIKEWGGTVGEPLATSRRSTPALVSLTNSVFASAFLPELSPDSVSLQPSREDIGGQPSLHNWDFESDKNETDYLGLGLAMRELLDSGVQVIDQVATTARALRPGDIGVLCRKNDQVELAVTSLTRWGIASASPRSGLLGTAEGIFVMACLRRLHDATDTVASALVLTLADGASVEAWLSDRLSFLAQPDVVPHHWKATGDSAHPLLARLEILRPRLSCLTPKEALHLAAAESQVVRLSAQWSKSPQDARNRLANIEALVELGKTYEDECVASKRPATVSGMLRWLAALVDAEDDGRAATQDNAVTVLTHHGAKGLEWPVVVLTSMGEQARSALRNVRARTEGQFNPSVPLTNRFVHCWPKTWGKRKQPQAAVNAEASAIGTAMQAEALAENKRLFYVSMTRARDINIIVSCARKSGTNRGWVDEIDGATQLLFGESAVLNLAGGKSVERKSLAWTKEECAVEPPPQAPTDCNWFISRPPVDAEPLWHRPSSAVGGAHAGIHSERIGVRIVMNAKPDMTSLGTALHLCIARAGVLGRIEPAEVERILATWGVSGALDQAALIAQLQAFYEWLNTRWPGCPVHIEVPIEAAGPEGTRIRGRIDLLVDAADGWILVDHKANPGGSDRNEDLAQAHGPQLAAYAHSLLSATGKQVVQKWLYLPVAARALRLG